MIQRRGSEVVEGKFYVLATFTIHFTLCLIFIKVWPIEDFLFEISQTDKLHKLYDKFDILKAMYLPS